MLEEEQDATRYKLSTALQDKVEKMYERDVAANEKAKGGAAGAEPAMDDEYNNFLSELTDNLGGGGVPAGAYTRPLFTST